jgi:hypothetical protein
MPNIAIPPRSLLLIGSVPGRAFTIAQGNVGETLSATVARTRRAWRGHSAYLARNDRSESLPEEDMTDVPVGRVEFPERKTVKATFIYAGRIEFIPIPELDD